jgi:diguanylate cyclase (GGDEF)-like protein
MSDRAPATRLPFRFSLQTKLLSIVLLCVVVPLFTLGAYLLRRNEALLRERAAEGLTNHLLRKDAEIEAWTRERVQEAVRFSASFVIYEGLEALRQPETADRARRDLTAYLESLLGHNRVYESLAIVDREGRVLASTRPEVLEDWVVEALRQAGAGQSQILTPVRRSEALGRPTLVLLQSIQAQGTEQQAPVLGYFVERLDLREMTEFLAGGGSDFAPPVWLLDAEGGVVARAGALVATPGKERFPGRAVGQAEVTEGELPGLGHTLSAVRPLRGPLAGFLAAVVSADLAYQSARESRERLIAYGTVVVGVILALNFIAARRVLRPIHRLSEGARRVAGGDLEVYLPVSGRDEIADLTVSFNDMAQRIREGRKSLEQAHDELARINEGLTSANRALETLAITDGLTSLYNHRHFQDTLEKEIQRCEQLGRTLSLLLIDIDHFKQYNDRWGHSEGDAALRRVAAQIMKTIRATDMAFRYGGEELAVLLPSCPRTQAVEVAEKVRSAVRTASQRPGRFGGRVTVSIGVSTFPDDARVGRALVDMADAALYQAKAEGRDRVVVAAIGVGIPKTEDAAAES